MTHIIVLGTSEPQDFQLQDDGANLVGTGLDVDLEFRTTGLTAAQIEPLQYVIVDWLAQATGTVRVLGVEDMLVGTYHVRYTLTDSGGKVGYVPNLETKADIWRVVRV